MARRLPRHVALVAVASILLVGPGRAGLSAAEAADAGTPAATSPVVVAYFYGDGCPYCAEQAVELDAWETELDVVVHRYEVWDDAANRALFADVASAYGVEADAVPVTFIGDRAFVGFNADIAAQMRDTLRACEDTGCADPLSRTGGSVPSAASGQDAASVRVPWVGAVDLSGTGLVASTALLAVVDGFNPCSLWVLSILLALLLRTGSRGRLAIIGGTFLLVTAVIYGLFITGVFGALTYVGYLGWIRFAVAGLAFVFAIVNIKDYFWFKRGMSFTIPDPFKPRVYRGGRGLIDPHRSLVAVVAATVVMAAGVALVELPCTAGFPIVWSGLLADAGVSGVEFSGLLGIYLGIYLLDEVLLVAAVVVTMRISRFQEQQGRALKLVGGMVMLALAAVMALRPALLQSIGGTVVVFTAALAAAGAVAMASRLRADGRRPHRA